MAIPALTRPTWMALFLTLCLGCYLSAAETRPSPDPASTAPAGPLVEVPTISAEASYDCVVVGYSDADLAAMKAHELTAGGKPATGGEISLWGSKSRCQWVMPTPEGGPYVASLFLVSGDKRPGRFGYAQGGTEHLSAEFREHGEWTGCLKAFRITVPEGQKQTRMFITGDGVYFCRADISRVTGPSQNADGQLHTLAESSYCTIIRRLGAGKDKPACVVLAPQEGVEGDLGRQLAKDLGVPVAPEPDPKDPFPAFPAVEGATPDTNLIVLSAGVGGPLVQAMRRAELIAENYAIPGPGGYVIRTVPRPFAGNANVIVISAGDRVGLERGIKALTPHVDDAAQELIYDRFLVDSPSERWAKLRPWYYRVQDSDALWEKLRKDLELPFGGAKNSTPSRAFIATTHEYARRYWVTGNVRWAEITKARLEKMMKDDIYGGGKGADSHMELYGLLQGWDRVEEAAVFSPEDRLRITNYLLHRCVEGNEGFSRAYLGYGQYSGAVRMRHNHQTILGAGLMQAYIYFGRLYGLGRATMWKSWCDDLILNATYWGRAPENSPNYEPRTFLEVADMLHYQGLSTKGQEGTRNWPAAAARFLAVRDSFGLPACYGDCWDAGEFGSLEFFELMRDEWDWPAAQFAIDRVIRGYRYIDPKSDAADPLYAYLHGSTDVGGLLKPSDPAKLGRDLEPLTRLVALPMTEGYWKYMTGQIGNKDFWDKAGRPEPVAYGRTADKVIYRGGWGREDEYLLLETIGWADHGHLDLGAIVQYCQDGRLWIVDYGYNNTGAEHHSTLEIKRDGKSAWGQYKGQEGRWGDFRAGPQMFEIIKLDSAGATWPQPRASTSPSASSPSSSGPFAVVGRAKDMAGTTWVRSVSGGAGRPLVIEDTLTADHAGQYEIVFRLRLLGNVEGEKGKWTVRQKGAALPLALDLADGDEVSIAKWMPDDHARDAGAYPRCPFVEPGGIPKTIEWRRTIHLDSGGSTAFKARIGPVETNP
jgi:hypothetical protein